jgi:hypothetical protein
MARYLSHSKKFFEKTFSRNVVKFMQCFRLMLKSSIICNYLGKLEDNVFFVNVYNLSPKLFFEFIFCGEKYFATYFQDAETSGRAF